MKRYMKAAFLYAILAMVGGVFYREFTKYLGFKGFTVLGLVHTHYFLLGMVLFLILLVLEKNFAFTQEKTGRVVLSYQLGLNLTAIMLLTRGICQVTGADLTPVKDAAISGLSGIGHVFLGISLVILLLQVKKSVNEKDQNR